MASLITDRMRFLHLPKTGGTWVTQAIWAAGVDAVRPPSMPFHADLAETAAYDGRFTFACVRHPLEFWRSYWAYRMRDGWHPESEIDAAAASPDLNEFARRVAASLPGAAGALYEAFVGAPGAEIDFIGRHERLADDVCTALRLAGEPFDERALRRHPAVNTSEYSGAAAWFEPDVARALARSERAAIERFYPFEPIPRRLVRSPAREREHARLRLLGRVRPRDREAQATQG